MPDGAAGLREEDTAVVLFAADACSAFDFSIILVVVLFTSGFMVNARYDMEGLN